MKNYAKIENGNVEVANVDEKDPAKVKEMSDEGFKEYKVSSRPTDALQEYQSYRPVWSETDYDITLTWEIVVNTPMLIQREINSLTSELASTDYKVVKNREYIDAGEAPYYDPVKLHAEREPIREKIRELEQLLEE